MNAPSAAVLADQIISAMTAGGLMPSGVPIPGELTLTRSEEWNLKATVIGYNRIIRRAVLSRRPVIPVISSRLLLSRLGRQGVAGFSGEYFWFDPANTAFSLDGVHPNNAGYGIIANTLIFVMNILEPGENIPYVNLEMFRGQYTATGTTLLAGAR
jgi:hypothetical protein